MIGIIGAMHEEISELKKEIGINEEINKGGYLFTTGILNGREVAIVECGIGKVNAAVCTTILLERFNVTSVIFTGVAGGINPEIEVGDIVISKDLIEHDFDTTAFGDPFGKIPRMDEYIFKADKELINKAEQAFKNTNLENRLFIGRVLSGDQFISSIEKIKFLRDYFSGDCCEMEGAAVAHVCYLYNIPFVVIRSISDKADHSATVDFQTFVVEAAVKSKRLVKELIKLV